MGLAHTELEGDEYIFQKIAEHSAKILHESGLSPVAA